MRHPQCASWQYVAEGWVGFGRMAARWVFIHSASSLSWACSSGLMVYGTTTTVGGAVCEWLSTEWESTAWESTAWLSADVVFA